MTIHHPTKLVFGVIWSFFTATYNKDVRIEVIGQSVVAAIATYLLSTCG